LTALFLFALSASAQPSLPPAYLQLPVVHQETSYGCGAASLLSALKYWQAYSGSERSLYPLLETTPKDGTEPAKLVEAARKLGLRAELKSHAGLRDLKKALARGETVILDIQAWSDKRVSGSAWRDEWEDGHYVVLVGMDHRNAYVMDPSSDRGYGWLPLQELLVRWHDYEDRHGSREVNERLAILLSGKSPLKKGPPADPLIRVE
jgi:predicted double-glycine peptidase